jgi:hypothetical protein
MHSLLRYYKEVIGSLPGRFITEKEPSVPTGLGGWVDPEVGLDAVEKAFSSSEIKHRFPGR